MLDKHLAIHDGRTVHRIHNRTWAVTGHIKTQLEIWNHAVDMPDLPAYGTERKNEHEVSERFVLSAAACLRSSLAHSKHVPRELVYCQN